MAKKITCQAFKEKKITYFLKKIFHKTCIYKILFSQWHISVGQLSNIKLLIINILCFYIRINSFF